MKKLAILLIVLLSLALMLTACQKGGDGGDKDVSPNYTLIIKGIGAKPIVVTKAQILEIAKTKTVEYTKNNPCYASDKTDDNGNPIPRTLKGVYLDDILEVYADGAVSGSFSAMTLRALDGYETVLTSDTYNVEHGGSKMIIAYEYEGVILNINEQSGALRAIFPDQTANSWAKQLKEIEFSDAALVPPSPETILFMELIGQEFYGSFESDDEITYSGISMDALFEAGILNAGAGDKMYLIAWDYIADGQDGFYREYTNWKSYDYYKNAVLAYSYSENGGGSKNLAKAPVFDGANINRGMSVKNTLAVTLTDTALVSLDIAFIRYSEDNEDEIELKDLLGLVNMDDETAVYKVYDTDGNYIQLTYSESQTARIENINGVYTLVSGAESIEINRIEISRE